MTEPAEKWCVVCYWQSGFIFPHPCASEEAAREFAAKLQRLVGEPGTGLARPPLVTTMDKAGPAFVPPSMRPGGRYNP